MRLSFSGQEPCTRIVAWTLPPFWDMKFISISLAWGTLNSIALRNISMLRQPTSKRSWNRNWWNHRLWNRIWNPCANISRRRNNERKKNNNFRSWLNSLWECSGIHKSSWILEHKKSRSGKDSLDWKWHLSLTIISPG